MPPARQRFTCDVIELGGVVDRTVARQADALMQHMLLDLDGPVTIDLTGVEEINGALLGLLLRASRRAAWRNRPLSIICPEPEIRRGLEVAGIDELATVVTEPRRE